MSYENPEVPHEVNVSRDRPLVEFVRLAAGLALCVLVVSAILYFFGGWFARLIPFSVEQSWVGDRVIGIAIDTDGADAKRHAEVETYVRRLAADLAARSELPDGMTITAHYADMELPNAFATLGGHIVITRGLYERMPSENALAMVVAHEIAHVKARDPIAALGGAASVGVLLALFTGNADGLTAQVARLVQLGYSRDAETRADDAAVSALRQFYGHAGGAAAVFEVFRELSRDRGFDGPTLLSTHPADEERIQRLTAAARDWNAKERPLRPLAVSLADEVPESSEQETP
jgi:Zn-dependent protease with chaperone function